MPWKLNKNSALKRFAINSLSFKEFCFKSVFKQSEETTKILLLPSLNGVKTDSIDFSSAYLFHKSSLPRGAELSHCSSSRLCVFWVASNLSNKSFNFVLFLLVFDDVRMTSPVLISQESSSPISTFKKLLMKGGRVVIADLPGFLTVVVVRMTNFLNRLSKRITQVKNYGHFKKSSEGETLSVCWKNRRGKVIFLYLCQEDSSWKAFNNRGTKHLHSCYSRMLIV